MVMRDACAHFGLSTIAARLSNFTGILYELVRSQRARVLRVLDRVWQRIRIDAGRSSADARDAEPRIYVVFASSNRLRQPNICASIDLTLSHAFDEIYTVPVARLTREVGQTHTAPRARSNAGF